MERVLRRCQRKVSGAYYTAYFLCGRGGPPGTAVLPNGLSAVVPLLIREASCCGLLRLFEVLPGPVSAADPSPLPCKAIKYTSRVPSARGCSSRCTTGTPLREAVLCSCTVVYFSVSPSDVQLEAHSLSEYASTLKEPKSWRTKACSTCPAVVCTDMQDAQKVELPIRNFANRFSQTPRGKQGCNKRFSLNRAVQKGPAKSKLNMTYNRHTGTDYCEAMLYLSLAL